MRPCQDRRSGVWKIGSQMHNNSNGERFATGHQRRTCGTCTKGRVWSHPRSITMTQPPSLSLRPIGTLHTPWRTTAECPRNGRQPDPAPLCTAQVLPEFVDGLQDLEGFSHLILLYWLVQASYGRPLFKPPFDPQAAVAGSVALSMPLGLMVGRPFRPFRRAISSRCSATTFSRAPTLPSSSTSRASSSAAQIGEGGRRHVRTESDQFEPGQAKNAGWPTSLPVLRFQVRGAKYRAPPPIRRAGSSP